MDRLWNETGHSSLDERNSEAIRMIEELLPHEEAMFANEQRFVKDMAQRKDENNLRCSAKHLFWLRDLYSKYVLEE